MSEILVILVAHSEHRNMKTPDNERCIRSYYYAGIAAQAQKVLCQRKTLLVIIFSTISCLTLLTYSYEQCDASLFRKSCNRC
jgi:hypothetical protein